VSGAAYRATAEKHAEVVGVDGVLPEPRFALAPNTIVVIRGRSHLVRARSGGQLIFADILSKDTEVLTDSAIARLQAAGKFRIEYDKGLRRFPAVPRSPLLVGAAAQERAGRAADYVDACLRAPNFRMSRPFMTPIIAAVAHARGEAPPGFTTVLAWVKQHELYRAVYGAAAFARRDHAKGQRGARLEHFRERALQIGIGRWLKGSTKIAAYAAVVRAVRLFEAQHRRIIDKSQLDRALLDRENRLRPPALRTFERRCDAVNQLERDWSRYGERYATQRYRTFSTTELPERPYQEVEVDHTTLGIMLITPDGMVLGRADLIVFLCRATRMIVGYGIGYDQPGYPAFIKGLQHATYPKDLSRYPMIRNPWPCYGRIEKLYVDNALHFIGDNIRAAGRELNFEIIRLQPRRPWLKGAIERMMRSLGVGFIHALPGTTLSNIASRKERENLGEPCLTLDEFEALLNYWICDIYHAGLRKALGLIRGMGTSTPLETWKQKAAQHETPLLPSPELFLQLAGDHDERTIQRNGITWQHITYESSALVEVRSHPKHRMRGSGHAATKYKMVRDPSDLGQIYLVDHHTGRTLTIPATVAHRRYATGLSLHQHQVAIAHARRVGSGHEIEGLMRAMDELAKVAEERLRHPSRKQIERRVARFLDTDYSRSLRSSIETLSPSKPSPAGFLDFGSPPELPPEVRDEVASVPDRPEVTPSLGEVIAPMTGQDDDDDEAIIALLARKGWSSGNDL